MSYAILTFVVYIRHAFTAPFTVLAFCLIFLLLFFFNHIEFAGTLQQITAVESTVYKAHFCCNESIADHAFSLSVPHFFPGTKPISEFPCWSNDHNPLLHVCVILQFYMTLY